MEPDWREPALTPKQPPPRPLSLIRRGETFVPADDGIQTEGGWWHAEGKPEEGLNADLRLCPAVGEPVTLPHSRLPPDTPFWYWTTLILTEPTALRIVVDDGCQVFLDGERILCEPHGVGSYVFFALRPGEPSTHSLVVRVLNNAARGGLEQVHVAPLEAYERWMQARMEQEANFAELPRCRRSLPTEGAFSFTVWSDSHLPAGTTAFQTILTAMTQHTAAFSVGVGDTVSHGSDPEVWRQFTELFSDYAAETPLFLLPGNHDYDGCYDDLIPRLYRQHARTATGAGYFSWTCGNAFFLALDPNDSFPIGFSKNGAQVRWFQEQLASDACRNAKWRFLFVHQPPYSQTWPGYAGDACVREIVEEMNAAVGVDFVVSGHTHAYERLIQTRGDRSIHYLILGGAGGGLEDGQVNDSPRMDIYALRHHYGLFTVEPDRIRFEAITPDGTLLDRIEAKK